MPLRYTHPRRSARPFPPNIDCFPIYTPGFVPATVLILPSVLGLGLGFPTESNNRYSVVGVCGPILKSTTEVTWAGGDSKSSSQRTPVGDTVKRVVKEETLFKTNAGRRMMFSHRWTGLSTRHTSLLSLITCIKILSHRQSRRGRHQ